MNKNICLVIPCYNEGQRLSIKAFIEFIEKRDHYYLLFVNDASTDNTLEILRSINHQRVQFLDINENVGKAEAIRRGVSHIPQHFDCSLYGYFDADMATPLSEIDSMLRKMNEGDYGLVFGSRLLRIGGNIKRSSIRHYIGRFFATLASLLLGLPIYDTQCGAKIFKKDLVPVLFEKEFSTKWMFDVEIFYRLKDYFGIKEFYKQVYEMPLSKWTDIEQSKIKWIDFLMVPRDFLKIYFRYKK
ncbi:glycosyltransferase [Bacteriovorax sp. DB6_IX]|uniref:glycosyltransferase n=1 Tax=Bacteriovorax sp. DB6_IX TaxID=1353530 RepID=UPI000389E598|nr:glycosyltransferase [Bacteriovorax sp. DB6_IX]EQC51054.1 glycosyltransferase, group 2 family protein [Bacteriovorax sp. DB6_IX]